MTTNDALFNYCLRLADNNLVLAQRLAEWCSKGPFLEEDLALTNMSLDLIGQAESLYEYAATLKKDSLTADKLAFLRSEREYYNCLLVEQPNGDFAFTMVKQFLFSAFLKNLYQQLSNSNNDILKGFAAKSIKEINYHFRHSSDWIIRFGNGTEESKQRVQNAFDELWRFKDDMFVMNTTDDELIKAGIGINLESVFSQWSFDVEEILPKAHLMIPEIINAIKGGYIGIHTEHLGHILCEMQYLQRAHPGSNW